MPELKRAVWLCLLVLPAWGCSSDSGGGQTADAGADAGGDAGADLSGGGDAADSAGDCTGDCAPLPPTLTEPVMVVPGAGLPGEVVDQTSNNNLDVVDHDGRFFLAFRTGPSHFASPDVHLYVISSTDQETWDYETTFFRQTDLREPRFLSFDGRLFLYFAVLGQNQTDFEPQGAMVSERLGPGDWTEPEWILDGAAFIPWRTKVVDGVPYMLGYEGGENIYDIDGEPIEVFWLTTEDGRNWVPVVPDQPVVLTGGSSETDFVFLDDGSLLAVSRNEAGDELGFGMKICRAQPGALGDWECQSDPRKYDSPLLFRQGSEVYLIGRRNISDTGNFDLGLDDLTPRQQNVRYQLDYWHRAKRCSLWRVDPVSLGVSFVLDLPSRGDTCFPGILDLGGGRVRVYNYTSPLDGPDISWLEGQTGPTSIYRIDLQFGP